MKKIIKTILLAGLVITSGTSFAKKKVIKATLAPRPQTSLVVDAESGKILHNVNGYQQIYPASLTKLMTLYMVFDAIEKKKLAFDQKLPVSYHAEKMKPSKLGLRAGENITVRDGILGLIVKSANDVAVVFAEAIAKDEASFAKAMTKKAHQLGMKNSHFYNASGWHHPQQKTTATDLAKLTLAIKRDFPKYYPLFSQDSFVFNGRVVNGHNPVTKNYPGAEGMKTGYTIPAGFNLITTASRNGKKLIGVVTGSSTASSRNHKMMKLLDAHFNDHTFGSDVFANAEPKTQIKKKVVVKKAPVKKASVIQVAQAKSKAQIKKYASSKKLNNHIKKPTILKKKSSARRAVRA